MKIDKPIDITITINVRARMQVNGDVEILTEQILRDLAVTPLQKEVIEGRILELTFSVRNNLIEAEELLKKNKE